LDYFKYLILNRFKKCAWIFKWTEVHVDPEHKTTQMLPDAHTYSRVLQDDLVILQCMLDVKVKVVLMYSDVLNI